MNLGDAAILARDLMNYHGLIDWNLDFDRAKRRFGQAKFDTKTISLSVPLVIRNNEIDVGETIRHEIAHALVGHSHGHDDVWRDKALSIGSNGKVTYDGNKIETPVGKWIGVCELGHRTRPRHRRGNLVCKKDLTSIRWVENK